MEDLKFMLENGDIQKYRSQDMFFKMYTCFEDKKYNVKFCVDLMFDEYMYDPNKVPPYSEIRVNKLVAAYKEIKSDNKSLLILKNK